MRIIYSSPYSRGIISIINQGEWVVLASIYSFENCSRFPLWKYDELLRISCLYLRIDSNKWSPILGYPFPMHWTHREFEAVMLTEIALHICTRIASERRREDEWKVWGVRNKQISSGISILCHIEERDILLGQDFSCRRDDRLSRNHPSRSPIVELMILMEYYDHSGIRNGEKLRLLHFFTLESASSLIESPTLEGIDFPIYIAGIFQIYGCREVHESIVNSTYELFRWFFSFIRYPFSEISFHYFFLSFCELSIFLTMIVSSEYFLEIGIPGEYALSESKGEDCRTRISSYPWEFHEKWFILREYSSIFSRYDVCCLEKISCSRVVSHALIIREEFFITCSCEIMDARILLEDFWEITSYSLDLCLLEKYLREPDVVRKRFQIPDSRFQRWNIRNS